MRSDQYIVEFQKTKDYQIFNSTNFLVNIYENTIYIDFFSETVPFAERFIFEPDGTFKEEDKPDQKNIVHATAGIPLSKIPILINVLTKLYNRAAEEIDGGDDEYGDGED